MATKAAKGGKKSKTNTLSTYIYEIQIGRAQSELQSHSDLVCRLLLEKKKNKNNKKKKQKTKIKKTKNT